MGIDLINESDLPVQTEVADFGVSFTSAAMIKDASLLMNMYNQYRKLLKTGPKELEKICSFFFKSVITNDPIEKFIYAWIAFEMYYGWRTQARTNIKAIRALLGQGIPSTTARQELVENYGDHLSSIGFILKDRRGNNRSQTLKYLITYGWPEEEILEAAILACALVRHRLFHGLFLSNVSEVQFFSPFIIHFESAIIQQALSKI
jgi:hypothetical protein